MDVNDAREIICGQFGGKKERSHGENHRYRFPSPAAADAAKAILDAFHPGYTGAVFGVGRLIVADVAVTAVAA